MQKTDSLPERWEVVTNADDYRGFQAYFDERDKLAEKKKAVSAEGGVS